MKEQKKQSMFSRRSVGAVATLVLVSNPAVWAQCQPGTACEPGPRPVGSQSALFSGPVNSSGAGAPGACYTALSSQIFTVTFPLNNHATSTLTPASAALYCGSEANEVVQQFKLLSASQQQDLLNFLRSL